MNKKKILFSIISLVFACTVTPYIHAASYKVACIPSAAALTGADQILADYYHISYGTTGNPSYRCYFKFTSNIPICVKPQVMSQYSYVDSYPGHQIPSDSVTLLNKRHKGGLCLFQETHKDLIDLLSTAPDLAGLGNPRVYDTWERVKDYLD